jgi:hypothetical protein
MRNTKKTKKNNLELPFFARSDETECGTVCALPDSFQPAIYLRLL